MDKALVFRLLGLLASRNGGKRQVFAGLLLIGSALFAAAASALAGPVNYSLLTTVAVTPRVTVDDSIADPELRELVDGYSLEPGRMLGLSA